MSGSVEVLAEYRAEPRSERNRRWSDEHLSRRRCPPKSPILGAFQAKYAKNSNSYIFRSVYQINWHEIWQAAAASNRLRGWSRIVVKQFKDGVQPPFENRYIAICQRKIIRFLWNFVHSSRFWTGWTSRDQKWKSCIGQTPSSTERISCLNCTPCVSPWLVKITHRTYKWVV